MTPHRAPAVAAGLLAAAALFPLAAPPAVAQNTGQQNTGQQMAGRWQCQGGIRDPRGQKIAVAVNYVIMLHPNGTFQAQGVMQGGVARSQFQAQGRWQVNREGQRWTIVTAGQQVLRNQMGQVQRQSFYDGGTIYSLNSYGNQSRTQDGQIVATSCQRAG